MAWHLEAVGSGGVRGTGDQKTMTLAAYLYKKVIDNFTPQEFAKFEFPRIVKDDWPHDLQDQVRDGRLALLPAALGGVRSRVRRRRRRGPDGARGARSRVRRGALLPEHLRPDAQGRLGPQGHAATCPAQAQARRSRRPKDEREKFKPKAFTDNQKGMITAFNRYVCYIKPKEGDKEAHEQYVEVKYARARTYFEAQHWEEAALGFRDVAVTYPDKDVGIYAAQLYLESLNVLGTTREPPQPACFDEMAQDVPHVHRALLRGRERRRRTRSSATTLTKIQCDIERLQGAEDWSSSPTRGGARTRLELYEKARQRVHRALADVRRRAAAPASSPRSARRCDEVLYNAARAFQAARLIAKAIQARQILIDPTVQAGQDRARARRRSTRSAVTTRPSPSTTRRPTGTRSTRRTNPKGENADKALSDADAAPPRPRPGRPGHQGRRRLQHELRQHASRRTTAADRVRASALTTSSKENWDKARSACPARWRSSTKSATFDVAGPGARAARRASCTNLKRQRRSQGRVRQGRAALGAIPRPPKARS